MATRFWRFHFNWIDDVANWRQLRMFARGILGEDAEDGAESGEDKR